MKQVKPEAHTYAKKKGHTLENMIFAREYSSPMLAR